MNNEPRVAEFEAAFTAAQIERLGEGWRASVVSMLQEKNAEGDYANMIVRWAYWAWSTSRSSMVIQLPPPYLLPDAPEEAIDDSHMDAYHAANNMRQACSDRIVAAGAQVAE